MIKQQTTENNIINTTKTENDNRTVEPNLTKATIITETNTNTNINSNSNTNTNINTNIDLILVLKIIRIQRAFRRMKEKFTRNTPMGTVKSNSKYQLGQNNSNVKTEKFSKIYIYLENRLSLRGDNNFEFIGNKVKGQKEGFGKQIWRDGAIYNGYFQNNQAIGYGMFKHSDGDNYRGKNIVLIIQLSLLKSLTTIIQLIFSFFR